MSPQPRALIHGQKIRVGILFGGRSGEHEISLLSAASLVFKAIDQNRYEVVPIGITKQGRWVTSADAERLLTGKPLEPERQLRARRSETTAAAAVLQTGEAVVVPPEPHKPGAGMTPFQTEVPMRRAADRAINVDVIFLVLPWHLRRRRHCQGLLELAEIIYVGAGVLGSAAGMDKDIMKSLFRAAGLPIVKHVTILRSELESYSQKAQKTIERSLKYPVFVKPPISGHL